MSRLAMVLPTLNRIGGAERQTLLLARGLAQRGWRVAIVTLSGDGGAERASLSAGGVEHFTLEMRKGLADPRGWTRFRRWLGHWRPDVLHAHLPHAAWLCRWSRPASSVRAQIDTLHSASTGGWPRRLGYRCSRSLPACVTAVSRAVAEAHLARGMARPESLHILPNGVDTEYWRPGDGSRAALRESLGVRRPFLWLAAGRLEAVKDYPTLLRALARTPDAELVIAGAGELSSQLHALGRELGLEDRLRFLGFTQDLRTWMRAADGFALSSLWEGLPMCLLEAGACALPAAATSAPGVTELMTGPESRFLAPPGDPEAFAQAMQRLMAHTPAERAQIGLEKRREIVRLYSLPSILDRWESLYGELLRQTAST